MNSPWVRWLVTVLVALAVAAVAAATFVFSYAGMHAIALTGGVSVQLARYYPGLFDATAVIACVAVVMLRDGRWWARAWAWLVLVVVLAAIGASDVLHAMNYTLRHRPTEGIVAAAPVVAVLLAFSLLLTLLRQSRTRPAPQPVAEPVAEPVAALPAGLTAVALPPVPAEPATEPVPATEPSAVIPPPDPSAAVPSVPAPPAVGEPAPPTVEPPTVEPPTVDLPAVEPGESPRPSRGIRYASTGAAETQSAASEPAASEPEPESPSAEGRLGDRIDEQEYWESAEAGPFAGLVYAAHDDDPAGGTRNGGDVADSADASESARQPVPHLNRVRSTPAPPADDEDE